MFKITANIHRGLASIALCTACVSCGSSSRPEAAGFSGEDMTGIVEIVRDRQTKSATVSIMEDMEWTLYAGPSVEGIDFSAPAAENRADGTFPLEVPVGARSYFQFDSPRGKAILAERHLPMEGGFNFRDLGGYRGAEGRYVKWGKFIRADELGRLTDADLAYLASVPVVTVVDFRAQSEVERMPDRYPQTVVGKYHLEVNPGNVIGMEDEIGSAEAAAETMRTMYRAMINDPNVVAQYRRFFELLQGGEVPVAYHCSAGKDRTGMASALILFALGVDEGKIMEDYLLSNKYLGSKYESYIAAHPEIEPLMIVDRSFLEAGIEEMVKLYGSPEGFLREALGVDIDGFRSQYLY